MKTIASSRMKKEPFDVIEQVLDGNMVQHGPMNDRIYLMKTAPESRRICLKN
jgi:hypothetical protein